MRNLENLLFDLFLFLLVFPYLLNYKCSLKIFKLLVLTIIVIHLWILYCRYSSLDRECKFPVYCEIISIIFGLLFILDGYYTKNYINILMGIIIMKTFDKHILYYQIQILFYS